MCLPFLWLYEGQYLFINSSEGTAVIAASVRVHWLVRRCGCYCCISSRFHRKSWQLSVRVKISRLWLCRTRSQQLSWFGSRCPAFVSVAPDLISWVGLGEDVLPASVWDPISSAELVWVMMSCLRMCGTRSQQLSWFGSRCPACVCVGPNLFRYLNTHVMCFAVALGCCQWRWFVLFHNVCQVRYFLCNSIYFKINIINTERIGVEFLLHSLSTWTRLLCNKCHYISTNVYHLSPSV